MGFRSNRPVVLGVNRYSHDKKSIENYEKSDNIDKILHAITLEDTKTKCTEIFSIVYANNSGKLGSEPNVDGCGIDRNK